MERIALADKFFDIVRNGEKISTLRYRYRDYKIGAGIFYSDTSEETALINITNVIHKTFMEINDDDALLENFNSAEELKSELRVFYPDIKDSDEVTQVMFKYSQEGVSK
jgi:hypothetical protein